MIPPNEIISIPAGSSYPFIKANLVHAFPSVPRGYPYVNMDVTHVTFRKAGGVMETIYLVVDSFDLDPYDPDWRKVNPEYKGRVQNYIRQRMENWPGSLDPRSGNNHYRFYILQKERGLRHNPSLPGRRGFCYVPFRELVGEK